MSDKPIRNGTFGAHILSLRCNGSSYSATPSYIRIFCCITFPPGPGQLSSPFFLASDFYFYLFHFTSIPSLSLPFYCRSVSPFFIIYQFLLIFLLSSFPLSLTISYGFLFCPSCTTQTLLLLSFFASV